MARPQSFLGRQRGIITQSNGWVQGTRNLPIPRCSPTAVLVKVHSVALNPSDYKMPDSVKADGLIAGNDFAGEIVEIGSEANVFNRSGRAPWAVHDRVCGAVHGSNRLHPAWGAFAEFVEADPCVLSRIPADWSWSDAAAVGGSAVGAVGLGLFQNMRLTLPPTIPRSAVDEQAVECNAKTVILVYGGSTACGTMALQLLRLAGYTPIATCSPHSNALVMGYGAKYCFDYHTEDCAQQIKAYTKQSLALVLDCIATPQSAQVCYASIGRTGGKYVALEMLPKSVTASRRAVRASFVMAPVMAGRRIDLGNGLQFDPDPEAREFGRKWYALVETLIEDRSLRPHPVRRLAAHEDWTESVINGLMQLKKGLVSGEKLVVSLD